MTSVSFVCVARDAGRAVWDLNVDLAVVAQPGDQVIWIDDSGPGSDTARWLNRFAAMEMWPDGVARETVITGTRGLGDMGIALNLGLARATGTYVLVLEGAVRLSREAVAAARKASVGTDLVLCGASPLLLSRMMFRRTLLACPPDLPDLPDLRCEEATEGWGDLALAWGLLARAGQKVREVPLATVPHPVPRGPGGLFQAADRLCTQSPEAALWIAAHLPGWLRGAGSGAVAGLLEQARIWATRLPHAPEGAGAGAALITALRAGNGVQARHQMRALCRADDLPGAPPPLGSAPMRVWLGGPHSKRTPFAYPALAPLWEGRIEVCETLEQADLAVWAHPLDLLDLSKETVKSLDQSLIPAALISEEPFWDSIFSPDPLAPVVTLRAAHLGGLALHQVNHHRSPIFDFAAIPYFLMTDAGFIEAYRRLFARNAALSARAWTASLAHRPTRAVFMAERRPEAFHDIALPAGDLLGLCAWRTRLAADYTTGMVARLGASWQGGATRFDLADWHADKITRLDGQAELVSALENTHQPAYVSEKLFDAFACGARPLYLASPGHRVHDLGLPEAAWINLWGMDSTAAAIAIDAAPPFAEVAVEYAQAQSHLAALFHDEGTLERERARLGAAVTGEVARLIDLGRA